MPLPTFNDISSYELSQSNLWTVQFDKSALNVLGADSKSKIFPATDVTFSEGQPLIYETELREGIPLAVYYGVKPVTSVNVSFFEDASESVSKEINSWIKGKYIYDEQDTSLIKNGYNHIAVSPTKEKYVKMTITKYRQNGKPNKSYIFYILCPKDPLQYQLSEGDNPIGLQIEFKVIGAVL